MAHGVESAGLRAPADTTAGPTSLAWAWAALVLSAVGLAGSLLLSLGLGLKACPLCFYQRTFIMSIFAVMSVRLTVDRTRAGLLCLVSLPLASGGLGVAAFHEYLVVTSKLECPPGVFGLGTAPAQSLAIFVLLTAVTGLGAWAGGHAFQLPRVPAVLGAAVLGLLLASGAVASAPPMPPAPTKPYDPAKQPLDICRPPFHTP
jgi:disulfide bond formation protein DsbB